MRPLLLLLAVLLSASEWASAQSRPGPDPTDPRTPAPPPQYQSTFSDYQPFRDEKVRSWKDVNKEVADNPGMGSMKHESGTTMPGMDAKTGDAPKGKGSAAGHDMSSMKGMPGKTNPGTDAKTGDAPKRKQSTARHDMGSMHHKPGAAMHGMEKPAAAAAKSKEGHDTMAMAKPQTTAGQTARISGTGSVLQIDKSNGKVKLTHDPIAAMGWPRMTMFFRLKESSLADQVKIGDKVEFTLEKSVSGYVISSFQKSISESNPTVNAPKPAGHGKH